jgi:Cu/Ag efflux pump CusA
VFVEIGGPLTHRIAYMLSGVRSDVAVKIFGEDLDELRDIATRVESVLSEIRAVADLAVEQQVEVPQVHLKVDRDQAALYGFTTEELINAFEVATNGRTISDVYEGQRTVDLVLLLHERHRSRLDMLGTMRLMSPSGAVVLLDDVADIVETYGPNRIGRENASRRIIVSCNVRGRDLGRTVAEIRQRIDEQVELPKGYWLRLEGTFESQQRGTRTVLLLSVASVTAMFALIYHQFRSLAVSIQVLLNIPFAFIGAVAALWLVGETFNLASLVGFIGLCGIASRNGVLMISHYLHLAREEGMPFGPELVIRGSQERVAPVLMTALTAGLALIPLASQGGEPGKEILYPVAITIIGGLITSTLLDFFVTPTVFLRFGRAAVR